MNKITYRRSFTFLASLSMILQLPIVLFYSQFNTFALQFRFPYSLYFFPLIVFFVYGILIIGAIVSGKRDARLTSRYAIFPSLISLVILLNALIENVKPFGNGGSSIADILIKTFSPTPPFAILPYITGVTILSLGIGLILSFKGITLLKKH